MAVQSKIKMLTNLVLILQKRLSNLKARTKMSSEFLKQFPKPNPPLSGIPSREAYILENNYWRCKKEGWLAAFRHLQERAKLHHRGCNIFHDIEQEIKECENEGD
jgi:hypothetical protein